MPPHSSLHPSHPRTGSVLSLMNIPLGRHVCWDESSARSTLPSLRPLGKIPQIHLKHHPVSLPLYRRNFSLICVSRAQHFYFGFQNTFSVRDRIWFIICFFVVDADTLRVYKPHACNCWLRSNLVSGRRAFVSSEKNGPLYSLHTVLYKPETFLETWVSFNTSKPFLVRPTWTDRLHQERGGLELTSYNVYSLQRKSQWMTSKDELFFKG